MYLTGTTPDLLRVVRGGGFKEIDMPKKEEEELKRRARRLGLTGEAADSYVYGTLRKMGWKPPRERRKKK